MPTPSPSAPVVFFYSLAPFPGSQVYMQGNTHWLPLAIFSIISRPPGLDYHLIPRKHGTEFLTHWPKNGLYFHICYEKFLSSSTIEWWKLVLRRAATRHLSLNDVSLPFSSVTFRVSLGIALPKAPSERFLKAFACSNNSLQCPRHMLNFSSVHTAFPHSFLFSGTTRIQKPSFENEECCPWTWTPALTVT